MMSSASDVRSGKASRLNSLGWNRVASIVAFATSACLGLVLSSCASFPQPFSDYKNEVADAPAPAETLKVSSGVLTKLDYFYSLNEQCTSLGMPEIVLSGAPQKGTFSARAGHDYPKFSSDSAYHACNTKLVPAAQFYYQSNPGYVGEDTVSVALTFPDGGKREMNYKIIVE
jgi:hypothetical protein